MDRLFKIDARDEAPLHMIAWITLFIFLATLALGGGGSRADVLSQLIVRLSALFVLAIWLWFFRWRVPDDLKPMTWFVLVCFGVVAIQLLPLPPAIWTALPGRGMSEVSGEVAGLGQPWRPLSLDPDSTWNSFVALLPVIATIATFSMLGRQRTEFVFQVVLVLIAVSSLLGAVQLASGPDSALRFYRITNEDSAVGLFANRNHQAMFVACGFPLFTWWAARSRLVSGAKFIRLAVVLAGYAFLFMILLTTGSRGGLVLGILAAVLSWWALTPGQLRSGLALGLLAMIGAGTAAALFDPGRLATIARLLQGQGEGDVRFRLLGDYWLLIARYFPVGAGFGTFPDVYRQVERLEELSPNYLNHAHNDLVELAIESGIAGLVLLLAALFWIVPRVVDALRRARHSQREVQPGVAAVVITVLLLGSLVDYPLRTPMLASLCVACCAVLAYGVRGRREPAEPAKG